ncbi:MAG: nucleoside deaminase [Firmicutes bacterium]|nr:nucleoside deaminase [Bacillota bacterium]
MEEIVLKNEKFLKIILNEAEKALKKNEVPVGCIIVKDENILSKAHNTKQKKHACINHAEILAVLKAEKKIEDWRLDGCDLYVTLEPCKMCMEVIRQARIKNVYYLLPSKFNNEDNKKILVKQIEENEVLKEQYYQKIKEFFARKR